jgi:hypothetical protein
VRTVSEAGVVHKRLAALATIGLLLLMPAAAQDPAAQSQWIDATCEKLARFLPDATSAGLTPEQYIFKGAANDSPHKYICVLAHRFWQFDDPELSHQIDELKQQEKSLTQQLEDSTKQFEKDHKAEIDAAKKQIQVLQNQYEELMKQGKYKEGLELADKIADLRTHEPEAVFIHSFDKRSDQIEERRRYLSGRWRTVNFRLGTNRTLVTAIPSFHLQPSGILAGHLLYREQKFDRLTPDHVLATVGLAIFLGPPGYQNPRVKLGESELALKCIFVWAWIESRPDTVQAYEAIVRKILEKMDYEGLSRLIEH